jgi:pSer/pThr/pTyr-binding forkhead associated (FHA) protein
MRPGLVVISGPKKGAVIYLDEPIVSIGRRSLNDRTLRDPHVSREHCRVGRKGRAFVIEDLNSANGVYVNGKQVSRTRLKDGCSVQIGTLHFRFSVGKRPQGSYGNYCSFFLSKVVKFLRSARPFGLGSNS